MLVTKLVLGVCWQYVWAVHPFIYRIISNSAELESTGSLLAGKISKVF